MRCHGAQVFGVLGGGRAWGEIIGIRWSGERDSVSEGRRAWIGYEKDGSEIISYLPATILGALAHIR